MQTPHSSTIYVHFPDTHEFEKFAAYLWALDAGGVDYEVTRASVDGGRDAIGEYRLGPATDPIRLSFALEAKRYAPTTGVGVEDTSRLISRLRHREFGVLVTTSYVARQAYRELREDRHPVVILAGRDIVESLKTHGLSTVTAVKAWAEQGVPTRVDLWPRGNSGRSETQDGEAIVERRLALLAASGVVPVDINAALVE